MTDADIFDIIKNKSIKIDRQNIIERLYDRYRWPLYYSWGQAGAEVIKKDGNKMHSVLFDKDGYVNSEKIVQHYNEGYTILLSNVGSLFTEFREISDLLTNHFKNRINLNLYAGSGSKSVSFPPHKHEYEVLVKNISGKSIWTLGNKTVSLENQDIIYIPKFENHSVKSIEGDKISLTCNITRS